MNTLTTQDPPRADRAVEAALWKRLSAARNAFNKRRKAYFAELTGEREQVREEDRRATPVRPFHRRVDEILIPMSPHLDLNIALLQFRRQLFPPLRFALLDLAGRSLGVGHEISLSSLS